MSRQLRRRDGRPEARPSSIRPLAVLLVSAAMLVVLPQAASGKLEPKTISPADVAASSPSVASDGAGNVVAVWRELADDKASIRAASRSPGGEWSPSAGISVAAAATEAPELAMDRLGNAVAVWHRSNGRDSVVQAAVRPAGGAWSAPQDLSSPGELAFNADVAVAAGRAIVVWASLRDLRSVVRSSTRTISGPWSQPETASDPISNAYAPQVAMDDQGNAVASWQWWDGAYRVVQAALRPVAGPWGMPETLSGTGRDASRPRLAMDAAGAALVGWLRFDGSWTPRAGRLQTGRRTMGAAAQHVAAERQDTRAPARAEPSRRRARGLGPRRPAVELIPAGRDHALGSPDDASLRRLLPLLLAIGGAGGRARRGGRRDRRAAGLLLLQAAGPSVGGRAALGGLGRVDARADDGDDREAARRDGGCHPTGQGRRADRGRLVRRRHGPGTGQGGGRGVRRGRGRGRGRRVRAAPGHAGSGHPQSARPGTTSSTASAAPTGSTAGVAAT